MKNAVKVEEVLRTNDSKKPKKEVFMREISPKKIAQTVVMSAAIIVGAVLPFHLREGRKVEAATTGRTKEETVTWCINLIGKPGEDVDGAYGIQCVDLIRKYTKWLGKDIGPAAGNGGAFNYGTQSIPTDYYTRYNNSVAPQPGDIFVNNKGAYGASKTTGHVGIIYEVGSNYYKYIDFLPQTEAHAARGAIGTTQAAKQNFSYIIRPNFKASTPVDPAPSHATSANIKDGTYMLRNAGSKYAMNWDYGSSARTVWMSKYGDENSNEQHFKFTHVGSGKYKIESCHSLGNVINCECGLPVTAGVKVTVRKYTDNDTQKFYVTPVGNGNYILQSASNPNLVIGAPSTAFHAALEIQNYSKGNNNQLWQFDQDPTLNPTYTITASATSNGTVKLSKTSAKAGEEITVTTTPASGYQLDTIKVNGSAISGSKFKMPAKNTTVAVTFKKVIYTVKVGTVSNGTAYVSKSSASIGDEITITATPSKNYELNWIKVNGSIISGNKFKMPAANATVDVNFKRKDAPAYGGTATVNGLKYKVTNAASDGTGTVALTGTANSAELVVIPETVEINGYRYTVNKIAEKAFFNNTKVKKVYIGEKITVIEANAFYGCTNLVQVTGGVNLKTIGQNAFARCSKLSEFVIASKVLYKIAPQAFYMDTSLKTISIKNTTKLTKSGVKKSLKGSSVKTVKVKKSKVKKYKKIFKKANSGKAVTVKK